MGGRELARKLKLQARLSGTVSDVYAALGRTLAFRRWRPVLELAPDPMPGPGSHYRCRAGSVIRTGRVAETIRPVAVTLYEILLDAPCRVVLTLRWRIEPVTDGCVVRLCATYRLNRAAALRARHWDRRLLRHFRNQFRFLAINLERATANCAQDRQTG